MDVLGFVAGDGVGAACALMRLPSADAASEAAARPVKFLRVNMRRMVANGESGRPAAGDRDLLPLVRGRLGGLGGGDADDLVGGGSGAEVVERALVVGGPEQDRARGHAGGDAVDGDLDRAGLDEDELVVVVDHFGGGALAGVESGDVAFEREEGERGRAEDADARAGGCGRLREGAGVDDGGGELAGDGALGGGFGVGIVGEIGDEVNDVVGGGRGADVLRVVRIVGGEEDHGAGAGEVLDAVDGDFEVALLDQEYLFPGVAMDGVRLLAGIEGGDVDFELVEGAGGVVEDLARLAGSRGLGDQGVPIDEGAGEDGGFFRRRVDGHNHGLLSRDGEDRRENE